MTLKNSIKQFETLLGDKESLLDKDYQRISDMIKLHWGYKEFYTYINKLMIVEKDKDRQGFPIQVLEELHILQAIHETIFPTLKTPH